MAKRSLAMHVCSIVERYFEQLSLGEDITDFEVFARDFYSDKDRAEEVEMVSRVAPLVRQITNTLF